jgi:hypothetical protein
MRFLNTTTCFLRAASARTNHAGGSFADIMKSLHTRVMALHDETLVLLGHSKSTTIGEEPQSNPFLRLR